MKEQVEVEGDVLARVVDADVHVELLLAQDEAIGDAERAVPQRARVLVVRQAEDGLHVARVQPVGALVQLPPEEELVHLRSMCSFFELQCPFWSRNYSVGTLQKRLV